MRNKGGATRRERRAVRVEVLVLDPLGAMHTLPENSNEAANLLMGALREIAERTGVAVGLVHHTGKQASKDMDAAGAGAARGASAFVDGARVVRQLRRAGPSDKIAAPPKDRWKHVRVDNGKANLAPAGEARWLRLVNVPLNNGTPDYPDGDFVQTVELLPPQKWAAVVSSADVQIAYAAVAAAPSGDRRASQQSPSWVGYLLGNALGLDLGPHKLKDETRTEAQELNRFHVAALIEDGLRDGWFVKSEELGPDRNLAPHITVGDPPADDEVEDEADPDTE